MFTPLLTSQQQEIITSIKGTELDYAPKLVSGDNRTSCNTLCFNIFTNDGQKTDATPFAL